MWKHFYNKILNNIKCVEEAVIWARRYHVQIWITTFNLHFERHKEKTQSEGLACFYVAKAEDVNVKRSYFLLVYIGILFVEFGVFISLQNLTYTRSTSTKRKEFSWRECMNHETPFFYFNAKPLSIQFTLFVQLLSSIHH